MNHFNGMLKKYKHLGIADILDHEKFKHISLSKNTVLQNSSAEQLRFFSGGHFQLAKRGQLITSCVNTYLQKVFNSSR